MNQEFKVIGTTLAIYRYYCNSHTLGNNNGVFFKRECSINDLWLQYSTF
jgi:hypothetical protein